MARRHRKDIGVTKEIKRNDAMASRNPLSSKGKARDVLNQQVAVDRYISPEEIWILYNNNNGVFSNIIDVPAEDASKKLPDFVFKDKNLDYLNQEIKLKLLSLDFQNKVQQMIKYERLYGNGFMFPIVTEKYGSVEKQLKANNLDNILSLNVFSVREAKFGSITLEKDIFSPNYMKPVYYNLGNTKVHPSRIYDLSSSKLDDSPYGVPILKKIYDSILNLDSTAWSVGQIVYSFVFKVLKSDEANFTNNERRREFQDELENEFNTSTIAVIGAEDDLNFISPTNAMNNLKDIFTFIWDLISAAAKMPKSHILGQPQGTVTGGQYDTINYYSKIQEYQEHFLKPIYKWLVDMLLMGSNTGVGKGSLVADYNIVFPTLWNLDVKEQADVDKKNAETNQIKILSGVLHPDEIRKREGSPPLPESWYEKLGFLNGGKPSTSGSNKESKKKGGENNAE